MKDWIGMAMQRIEDVLHERTIRKLEAEYRSEMARGRKPMAGAVFRDIQRAVERRSPEQCARMERQATDRLDPHARAVFEREPQV